MQINISEQAKKYRIDNGYSKKKVSEAVGLYYDEYIGLEDGSFSPSYYTVLDIAQFYNVPVSYIYDRNKVIVQKIIERLINKTNAPIEIDNYVEYKYEKLVDEDYT